MKKDNNIRKQLEAELEKLEIPEALQPELMVEKLKVKKRQAMKKKILRVSGMAASILVVVGLYFGQFSRNVPENVGKPNDNSTQNAIVKQDPFIRNTTVGDSYVLAQNYNQVRDNLAARKQNGFGNEIEKVEDLGENTVINVQAAPPQVGNNEAMTDYSKTNVQVEGIDESDYVKTDGKYLYYLYGEKCHILSLEGSMKVESEISTKPEEKLKDNKVKNERFQSLFIDGDRLYLVATRDIMLDNIVNVTNKNGAIQDLCFLYRESETVLYTYDISDRMNPKEIGCFSQDGNLVTARKIDNYVYLFSYFEPQQNKVEDVVPNVQGKKVGCDCIYVREGALGEFVVSSIACDKPSEKKDSVVVLGDYGSIYMGWNAIYLYRENWNSSMEGQETEITKFSYKDGRMNGVGSCKIAGGITDSFAISEYKEHLRVVTTSWGEKTTNQLYTIDEKMKILGEIKGIAKGESIYAAKFLPNRAYVVTYLNHDPLFVIDLSDEKNPKILGQVEISGYSDYLHVYDDNLILGVGYETDDETGEVMGIKLTMFDCSNPANPKVVDSIVSKNYEYLDSSMDCYKSLLVDPAKNLIGFGGISYEQNITNGYELYTFENGKFKKLFKSKKLEVEFGGYSDSCRGLYSGNDFILVRQNKVERYDMKDEFAKTGTVELPKK